MVLVAAARGQQDAFGKLFQKLADRFSALARVTEVIEAEFEENLSGLGFTAGVVKKSRNVWQAQRDAYAGERSGLRHWSDKKIQNSTAPQGIFPGGVLPIRTVEGLERRPARKHRLVPIW